MTVIMAPAHRPRGILYRAWRKLWHVGHHRRPWSWVAEPRWVTSAVTAAYLVLAVAGVLAIARPPAPVEVEAGLPLTTAWAGLLTVGGGLGAGGALPGLRYLERSGIYLLTSGIAIYAYVAAGAGMVVGAVICAAGAPFMAARLARIWGTTLDPTRGSDRALRTGIPGEGGWTPKP